MYVLENDLGNPRLGWHRSQWKKRRDAIRRIVPYEIWKFEFKGQNICQNSYTEFFGYSSHDIRVV